MLQTPATETAGDEAGTELAVRWHQPSPEGGTARDAVLLRLRTGRGGDRPTAIEDRDLRGIRLIGEDLSGLDLSRVDLSGADLSRANLSGTRLIGANLRDAILFETDLTESELLKADLTGADLSESRAERAGFGGADLTGAKLFAARLDGATFTQAKLRGADLRAASLRETRLLEADLSETELSRADLRGASLEKSDLTRANLVDIDLREARLRGVSGFASANWVGADILDVDFCGCYLVRRTIQDQNYLHEFRNQSRVSAAVYHVWWITSDCGRSFVRWGLWTLFILAVFAGLYEGVALDYGDHRTALSSFYYSVVTLTTLGYGDVVPASSAAQVIAMIEVVLGYVMLGGLLSIFSNKMSRRAD